jgi:hypothetical protein
MARQPNRFLEIYLADHLAASAAGLALVRRAAQSNTGTCTGDTLRRLTVEIDEDRHTLRRLVTDLGFSGSKPKEVVARAAEKVGRVKRNGQLRGDPGRRIQAFELHHLIERALRQREEVEQLRFEAIHQAFAGGISGARSGSSGP